MKSILVPTDFSATSTSAIQYAAELVKHTQAKMILLHAYYAPTLVTGLPVAVNEVEETTRAALQKEETEIRINYPGQFVLETCFYSGPPVPAILDTAERENADLVVMGIQGAGYLEERMFGSTATDVIRRNIKRPVLVIGKGVKYHGIRRIAFAYDYKGLEDLSVLLPVQRMARLFGARVYVLNVQSGPDAIDPEVFINESTRFTDFFGETKHTYSEVINKDVLAGMDHFIKETDIDLLIMIQRPHSLIDRLFGDEHTKRMAFHTRIPLMVLPQITV